jgi:hypothetical protein
VREENSREVLKISNATGKKQDDAIIKTRILLQRRRRFFS